MTSLHKLIIDKKRVAWISLLVGVGMFISKFSAYLITGSSAIFSDAAESVVHVAATIMALYSIYLSAKPADDSHLYGHGNVEFFSAGVEGLLIFIAAITIIYFSVDDLLHGVSTKSLDVGTAVIGVAGLINLFLGLFIVKKGKDTNSLTLIADGKHVLTDSYTSIGVVIGLTLVLITGVLVLDPIIAIIVASNILITGFKLMRESIGGLMNETDKQTLELISSTLKNIRKEYWIDIHHLRFWKSGDLVVIDFHFLLPFYFTIKESHLEENYIENEMEKIFPNCSVRIHMDYCNERACKFCENKNCSERKEPHLIDYSWTTELMIGDPVYIAHGKMLAKT